ncbi:ModD protein [Rhodoferax fermentans]|uniref:Putative pyrophosphorylase ModD n=1 Tax=Rhodoferax fermentans TaxID=28066 RepID=A0A1T1ATV4_RHOFE|nr:ModD protein [Rhodoferax fermentans]MBK1685291.1 ModD protein [Rhodoferax fermentans]OOV07546.1 ModD protein [Rhodoferax fermentans]
MLALNDTQLQTLLQDDAPFGDITTDSLGIGTYMGQLSFYARLAMTVCGTEEACRLFELAGAQATLVLSSGAAAQAGDLLLQAHGPVADLHRAWKTAQTLVEWASGIGSATASIVAAANGVAVACTRKNVPGTKALSAKAVRAGGGILHRLGLSETILVFAEHRLYLNESPVQTIERLRRAQPEKKLAVEVANVSEALVWAQAGAEVLQLEKFTPEAVSTCRQALADIQRPTRPLLAAAGGIHAGNAAAYVAAGADFLVTSAPYWAPPRDVQVVFGARP